MIYLIYTIHVLISIFLIVVVLLQRGKGADLSVFGGGSTQAAFGARGSASLLHKLTVGFFVLFILTTVGIALLQGGSGSTTVLSGEATAEDSAPAADQLAGGDEAPATDAATPADAEPLGDTDDAPEPVGDAATEAPSLEAGSAETPQEGGDGG